MSEYIEKEDILSAAVEVEYLGRRRMMVSVAKIGQMPVTDLNTNMWCKDCKEYDKEHHRCPRFNRVIRTALEDADMVRVVRCRDCRRRMSCVTFEGIADYDGFCSMGERSD